MDQVQSVTDLDPGASSRTTEELFQGLYSELRRIAASRMARERPGHTLQATALVSEVWLRLSQLRQQTWRDDDHFIAAASETMRRILVDRARSRHAVKNGGTLRRTTTDLDQLEDSARIAVDHLLLDEHLARFAQLHPDKARILELRFFAGLTMAQIAALIGQSEKTVQRHWTYARAWLYESMRSEARK
jgi:RNA polymerase sigma factor (TIGR02999 family)